MFQVLTQSTGNINFMRDYQVKHFNEHFNDCEILLRGRNVLMGYLHLENTTKETIDEDRWLHTGDSGILDKDGFLFITGRIKELVITAGGENIPPLIIENAIKKLLSIIAIAWLSMKAENISRCLSLYKPTLLPSDKLTLAAVKWCRSVGSTANSVSDIVDRNDTKVIDKIHRYNEKQAISNAQRIQKWKVLPHDFSIPGPTAKLRRKFIE